MPQRMQLQAVIEMATPFADTDPYWRALWHLCQVIQEHADDIAELQVIREQYEALQDAHEALQLEHADLQTAYYLAQRALRRVQKDHGTDEHSPAEGDAAR